MATLSDLTKLKQRVEKLKQEQHRAEGALNEAMKRLLKDYECKSLEEAEGLLEHLEEEEIKAEEEFEEALRRFEDKWKEELK